MIVHRAKFNRRVLILLALSLLGSRAFIPRKNPVTIVLSDSEDSGHVEEEVTSRPASLQLFPKLPSRVPDTPVSTGNLPGVIFQEPHDLELRLGDTYNNNLRSHGRKLSIAQPGMSSTPIAKEGLRNDDEEWLNLSLVTNQLPSSRMKNTRQKPYPSTDQ